MKSIFFISLFTFHLIFNVFSQTNYHDYQDNDKQQIFFEDFTNNNYGWYVGSDHDCRFYTLNYGYYELKSSCTGQYTKINFNQNNGFYIDESRDFELESSIMYVSGEDNNGNQFFWGQGANQIDRFVFAISGNAHFVVWKNINNQWTDLKPWTPTELIKISEYNKLTIRKIANNYYFFINENHVSTIPFEPLLGQQLGWQTNQNTTIRINYCKLSYLKKPTVVKSDVTDPEIVIFEPSVSRGMKIVEAKKELTVRGKAIDPSGIYEVSINGLDAIINQAGEFHQTVKLAIGDNNILVKASDTRNNTSSYSFVVNREQEVNNAVVEDIAVNENEKRIALVIGNSNYGGGQTLKNPSNDANLMGSTLQKLGFDVIKRIDANKSTMELAIREFSKKLPNSTVALFYYAGHGVQVDGLNYLIPTDANLNEKGDCKFEAVSVNFVVEEFEQYPDNVNIVILDACRNNPFRSWARGGERGFKAINPTSGTIIAFATSEGSTASDGTGNNGLFTQELVKQMTVPQAIESVFKKTRVQVQKLSNGAQSPQEWSQLTGDFYFNK